MYINVYKYRDFILRIYNSKRISLKEKQEYDYKINKYFLDGTLI